MPFQTQKTKIKKNFICWPQTDSTTVGVKTTSDGVTSTTGLRTTLTQTTQGQVTEPGDLKTTTTTTTAKTTSIER